MESKNRYRKFLIKSALSLIIFLIVFIANKIDNPYTNESIKVLKKTLDYKFELSDKKFQKIKDVVTTFSTTDNVSKYSIPIQGTLYKKYNEDNKGIDIIAYEEYVKSIADGKVIEVNKKSTGIDIKVLHDNIISVYSQMEKVNVKEGEKVSRGHILGSMGDISSKSKKLHFEIWKDDKPINPLNYIQVDNNKPLSYK